jgi:hypothetical protein
MTKEHDGLRLQPPELAATTSKSDREIRKKEEQSQEWRQRFDDFHYGKFVLGIGVATVIISDIFKWPFWPMAVFAFVVMLTLLELSYWRFSRRIASRLAGLALTTIVLITGLYSLRLYEQIESDFKESENWIVPATVDGDSVSEVGYIYDVKRETDYTRQEVKIRWWVKVPATNEIYSCEWQSGYAGFLKDDGVELIHKKRHVETDDYSGFILGINGRERGVSSSVWTESVSDLELLILP